MALKIKVTTAAPKTKRYYKEDNIPNGIYLDAEGDIVVYDGGDIAVFSDDGSILGTTVIYPLTPAPKGTKIEITD